MIAIATRDLNQEASCTLKDFYIHALAHMPYLAEVPESALARPRSRDVMLCLPISEIACTDHDESSVRSTLTGPKKFGFW